MSNLFIRITVLTVSTISIVLSQTGPSYSVRTVAGTYKAPSGTPASESILNSPMKAISDRRGGYYIAGPSMIYQMDAGGRISVVAGADDAAFNFRDGIPATKAYLLDVWDIALNRAGELHFADSAACMVRKIDLSGNVRTVAGNGTCQISSQESVAATTQPLARPRGLAFDNGDNLLIAETYAYRIRKVDTAGMITTVAGNGTSTFGGEGVAGRSSSVVLPHYLAFDKDNNLYIAEYGYCRVRKLDASSIISTFFENIQPGCLQGGTNPQGISPVGLAFANNGTFYISEDGFHRVSTMVNRNSFRAAAGDFAGAAGFSGDGGPANAARLNSPEGLAAADNGSLLIADSGNHRVRIVGADGNVRTLAGASRHSGDGGTAASASLFRPRDMAIDRAGNLYFTDSSNHVIRKIDRAGVITTVAGTPGVRGSTDGVARSAKFSSPRGITVDANGNLYVTDWGTDRIRKIDSNGNVTTVSSTDVNWKDPMGIAVSADNNKLYVADSGNHLVRVIDLTTSDVRTVAGTGTSGFAGDQGPATQARLNDPEGVTIDRDGSLLIADTLNRRIRRVNLSTGVIDTVIGNGQLDDEPAGPARQVGLAIPTSVSADAQGNLYVALNIRTIVRMDAASGIVSTIAGADKSLGYSGDGGAANSAAFSLPWSARADGAGNVYVADTENHRIRILEPLVPSELRMAAGNNQSAPVGQAAGAQIRVLALSRLGTPVPGAAVTFSVLSGGARLSASRVFTDREGYAAVTVTMGGAPGEVQVRASVDNTPPVVFTLTAVSAPAIAAGGVVGGAAGTSLSSFTAGSLLRIRGQNLAAASAQGLDNMVAGMLPTVLGGVCVVISGTRAPMVSVSPDEIVAVMPRVAAAAAELRVVSDCGTPQEVSSAPSNLRLASAAPEFFADGAAVQILGGDGQPVDSAAPGDTVTLLAAGLGDTDPAVEPGTLAGAPSPVVQPFALRIGEVNVAASAIDYAGLSMTRVGVYEIRFKVPEGVGAGAVPVRITVGDVATADGWTMKIRGAQ